MHCALLLNEIFEIICNDIVQSDGGLGDLAALACTCKSLRDIPLDLLWGKRPINIVNVLKILPPDSWTTTEEWAENPTFSLNRHMSCEELERLRRYTTRITNLQYPAEMDISSEAFNALSKAPFEWYSMWPELKTLSWLASGDKLKFMRFFLPHGVDNLEINLEGASVGEARKALSIVQFHCTHLRELRLFDRKMAEDEGTQVIIRAIVCNNARTLRVFCSPRGSFSFLVKAVLKLSGLEKLEMHDPEIDWPRRAPRALLRSLERLILTLEEPCHIPRILGNIQKPKLKTFYLQCPYPVSEEDLEDLAGLFKHSNLYGSLNTLSWQPPRNSERLLTREIIATLTPFANMHTLILSTHCDRTCRFRLCHEHIVRLTRRMPQLRCLNFGGRPCARGGMNTDIGPSTLVELANNCPDLSRFTVHFNPVRFVHPTGHVKPNRNVSHWDVGTTVLPPANPLATTFIAMWASVLFPNAIMIRDMRVDTAAWVRLFEEWEIFLATPPVYMPPGLTM